MERHLTQRLFVVSGKFKIYLKLPSGKNRQKSKLQGCIFDNMALYFECRINSIVISLVWFPKFLVCMSQEKIICASTLR